MKNAFKAILNVFLLVRHYLLRNWLYYAYCFNLVVKVFLRICKYFRFSKLNERKLYNHPAVPLVQYNKTLKLRLIFSALF